MDKIQSEKMLFINEIVAGTEVRGLFLLSAASQQQARNGPFWRIELRDATGTLEGRIWSPISQTYTDLAAGQIAEVEGRADTFRDQIQVSLTRVRVLDEAELAGLNLGDFMPASRRPAADMLADIEALCRKELTHRPWRKFMDSLLQDEDLRARLLAAPAAKAVHHAWAGGLLEHVLAVARICMSMADLYPELDRQTLLVGALTHDMGKLWELSGGLANDYTDAGRLIGHISLGLERLTPLMRKAGLEEDLQLHLGHLILSHHGELQFGAPREPQTAEAFALHHADNMDAKLTQCRTLFAEELPPEEAQWSPYQGTLKRAVFRAPRTPDVPPKKRREAIKDDQCLLL